MRKLILAGLAATLVTAPAFAATEYYVARDNSSHKCMVVTKRPDGKTSQMIGTAGFESKSLAENALKADKECK